MDLLDNNLLINAFRRDAKHHAAARRWLRDALDRGSSIRLFPTVEAGFLRVVTHPKIFEPPTPMNEAWNFLGVLCSSPQVEISAWTRRVRARWGRLCVDLGLCGNDCNDAMLAALALEKNLRLVTFDQSFKRFPDLPLLILSE